MFMSVLSAIARETRADFLSPLQYLFLFVHCSFAQTALDETDATPQFCILFKPRRS